ncbi:DNA-methyltransferase [Neotabrizicola sp. sgz301269]|uniref:DNA-methyltransferase n=1 Tax=Neotabrizicola sp. sgz301269 TaxID=3276282 RepID=UPI00376F8A7B
MIIREERIGGQRLILGDCLAVMPTLGRFDACLTDPPYGLGEVLVKGGRGGSFERLIAANSAKWDFVPDEAFFSALLAGSDAQIIWGGNFMPLPPTRKPLCWDKVRPNQKNLSEWEMAWTSLVGRAQMFKHCANGGFVAPEPNVHPTQKPVALMEWCLGFLPDAKTILDPFMGSGTTLVACQRMGRSGTGIELDPDYFDKACRRVDEAARQPDLLIPAPPPPPVQGSLL